MNQRYCNIGCAVPCYERGTLYLHPSALVKLSYPQLVAVQNRLENSDLNLTAWPQLAENMGGKYGFSHRNQIDQPSPQILIVHSQYANLVTCYPSYIVVTSYRRLASQNISPVAFATQNLPALDPCSPMPEYAISAPFVPPSWGILWFILGEEDFATPSSVSRQLGNSPARFLLSHLRFLFARGVRVISPYRLVCCNDTWFHTS